MLDITQLDSATATTEYHFSSARVDYYAGAGEKPGMWGGEVASMLGLNGVVQKEDFAALCGKVNPVTGESLCSRKNEVSKAGYDVCYGPPKSVSVLHALTGDKNIQLALEGAFADTMRQIEQDALTRVRVGGEQSNRHTGKIAWAQFTHKYTRPTERDGRVLPDPHLHTHSVIMNVTYDPVEKKWKALQLGDIKRDASYFEACMHSRLIRRLKQLGYRIRTTPKGWEIAGISDEVIEKFSQRSKDVDEARLEEENLLGKELTAKQKAQLGRRTRKLKMEAEQLSELELKQAWRSRLNDKELESIHTCYQEAQLKKRTTPISGDPELERQFAQAAVDFSVLHHFSTNSVMDRRRLLVEAIKESYGNTDLETVEQVFDASGILTYEENNRTWCTTQQVRDEERDYIRFARESRFQHEPFNENPDLSQAEGLSDQQTLAYLHVLTSRDGVVGVRGKAGTGKTTMMRKIVKGVEQSGVQLYAFAPTSAAVDVMKEEGFNNTQTIQHFLLNEKLQQEVSGGVLWVDEAGLISSRQMAQLTRIAESQNCRIILSGDTGQHSGVERGDAMRVLETHGGLKPVQLDRIFRQKDPIYNDAVKHLADGEIDKAFKKMDQLGSIQVVRDIDRPQRLASEYLKSLQAGRSALVVSPTHREGLLVTTHIRTALYKQGKITGASRKFTRLQDLKLSPAQRGKACNYQPGQIIEPHANMENRRLPIGKCAQVVEIAGQDVWVRNHRGQRVLLDRSKAEHFNVFAEKRFKLYAGDKIRVSRIGRSTSGKKMVTGHIDEVDGFGPDGEVILKGGETLAADFGHFNFGYSVTSHSSQGRTVDDVYIAESAMSFPAATLEQFYVSCSRGRERLRIFTDDKDELKRAISRSCARKSAHDYDWDAQAKLRNLHPDNLQKVAQQAHGWLEHFAEPIAPQTTEPSRPSPKPEIKKDIGSTLSPQINQQPSIDIDL